MVKHKFGKCLVKRRFKESPKNPTQSIAQHTNIDEMFENKSIKSSLLSNFNINDCRIPPRLDHRDYPIDEYKTIEAIMFDSYKAKFEGYIFERNLEIWRQFWVGIERSDVIVQVIDARAPELFIVNDIFDVYKNKKHILFLNKCDLIGIEPCEYFRNQEYSMNSMKNDQCDVILQLLNDLKVENLRIFFINDTYSTKDILINYGKYTFAFVGFPNVGKSSTINNLFLHKRVKVSKTPGKTKYLQSLYLNKDCVVIDTPGIIFPTQDKIMLLLYGVLNPNTFMEITSLVDYIIEKIGINTLVLFYKLKDFVNDSRNTISMNFLMYFCQEKKCDNGKAVKIIVDDFMVGKIKNDCEQILIEEDYTWFDATYKGLSAKSSI